MGKLDATQQRLRALLRVKVDGSGHTGAWSERLPGIVRNYNHALGHEGSFGSRPDEVISEKPTEESKDNNEESKEETKDCVLCPGLYEGYGHNPRPLANEGRCCDDCNWNKVVPYRFYQAVLQHRAQQQEDEMDEVSTVGVEESKEEED